MGTQGLEKLSGTVFKKTKQKNKKTKHKQVLFLTNYHWTQKPLSRSYQEILPKQFYKTKQGTNNVLKMKLQKTSFLQMVQWTIHSNTSLDKWPTLVHLTERGLKGWGQVILTSSWLSPGPGSGPRTWSRVWSWYRPGSGSGWGPSYFFLSVVWSRGWVGVLSWWSRSRMWSRSPSGLSPTPLLVSGDKQWQTADKEKACNGVMTVFTWTYVIQ